MIRSGISVSQKKLAKGDLNASSLTTWEGNLAYFGIDEPACATCSEWLGGRAIVRGIASDKRLKAFQASALCKANNSFVDASFYCPAHELLTDES